MGSQQKNIHQEPTKIKNPRRFTDEQIKSLESIFELETKLEPTKKLEIAKNLDLQPRQIAIWFQNRRARWKSKQTEHEYRVLKAKYDDLHTQFDDLKKENHSLHKQLQDLVKNRHGKDADGEIKEYPGRSINEGMHHHDHDGEQRITNKYFEKTEDEELLRWSEEEEEMISDLALSQKWCNLSSGGRFDQSSGSGTSNWWEIS